MAGKKHVFLWLTSACAGVFIIQILTPEFTEIFMLTENALAMPWQFLTAVFLHGSVVHLLYNMFALIVFGMSLEQMIGSRRFLALFFISGILANLISFYWYPNALGASGAIMAVLGTLAVLRPGMSVWAFGMIIPMFIAAILWVAGSIMGIFGFGEQGVGHLAHLSGIVIGISYGIFLRLKKKKEKISSVVCQRKISLPENYMRGWEDDYMGR